MKALFEDLSQILGALACAPGQAQRILDQNWAESQIRWLNQTAELLAGIAEQHRTLLAGILEASAPSRQLVSQYEIECSVRLQVERGQRFAIRARPLNLGFEKVWGSQYSSACRVSLQVETVPFHAMPSAIAGFSVTAGHE